MTEIDNTAFLQSEMNRVGLREQVLDVWPEMRADNRYTLSNIRLPKPHKAAFSSKDLFEQQRSFDTADMGLALLLDVLHKTVCHIIDRVVPLEEFTFTMNFNGVQTPTSKEYSCQMVYPVGGRIVLTQVMRSMQIAWCVDYDLPSHGSGRIADMTCPSNFARPSELPAVRNTDSNREERGIDVDA